MDNPKFVVTNARRPFAEFLQEDPGTLGRPQVVVNWLQQNIPDDQLTRAFASPSPNSAVYRWLAGDWGFTYSAQALYRARDRWLEHGKRF